MIFTLTCLECQEVLDKPSDRKKFCSRQCQGRYQGKRSNYYRKTILEWADEEVAVLEAGYEANTPVDVIAAQLCRPLAGVYLKASRLGLTDVHRQGRPEENQKTSKRVREWWRTVDDETKLRIVSHPCSEETKRKLSEAGRLAYKEGRHTISKERRQASSDTLKRLMREDPRFGHPGRSLAGRREDLGFYVRSRWEANYARYLKLLQDRGQVLEFQYEPERFDFPDIKRGTRSYLPDFLVRWANGRVEYHEVKGYWTARARTAVKRFRARYPEKTLVVIEQKEYRCLTEQYAGQIAKWEKG